MKLNNSRVRVLLAIVVLVGLALLFRVFIVQVQESSVYVLAADSQHNRQGTAPFNRGNIFFTKKDGVKVSAATVQSGFMLIINPSRITNPEEVYEKLVKVLPDLDKDNFLFRANKKTDPYEEILRKIDTSTADSIEALELPGVEIFRDRWRIYPGDDMGSHVLGFVGYKGDELVGRYGLEQYYEDNLKRKKEAAYVNFFVNIFSNIKDAVPGDAEEGDIVTTIEPSVQAYLESSIDDIQETWSSEFTGGIIIDPKTGEIYAMANTPTFNPNTFSAVKDQSIFSNQLVESVFEMGSIMKPLTLAAGINEGVITPSSTYFDNGFIKLDGETVSNYDKIGRGLINMQTVLNESLNTGAAHVALLLEHDKFTEYFKNFGLGEKTGVDLPNEAQGLVKNLDAGRDLENATASFGQGIAISPITMVRALSTLANGGVLITPHLVKEIEYKSGLTEVKSFSEGRRVISQETSDAMSTMLVKTVDSSLIEGHISIPHFSIAAKTGTAQIPDPVNGGYYNDRFLHSFFGYFPAHDPEFLVFLYTYYPKDIRFSSETLPIPFMNIAKFLIHYYEVPPDR
jgi:cell division protein FtsI/penicillin-binding protein 2